MQRKKAVNPPFKCGIYTEIRFVFIAYKFTKEELQPMLCNVLKSAFLDSTAL